MSFLSGLFTKESESVVLIDIGSASVGGAVAHLILGQKPVMYFTVRIPIERRDGESVVASMERTLQVVTEQLVREGGPALLRGTGSGRVDRVLAVVASPWQETRVKVETLEKATPFIVHKDAVMEAVRRAAAIPAERTAEDETLIATLLNGYETHDPFGKRAKRVDMVILSSSLEKGVASHVEAVLRGAFHTRHVRLTAFAPVLYAVFRDIYPHQKDFIALDVTGEATDIALVKHGLLVGVVSSDSGVNDLARATHEPGATLSGPLVDSARNDRFRVKTAEVEGAWLAGVRQSLQTFAERHALPRILFLLADEHAREFLHRVLNNSSLRTLWLSDEPLSIISVEASHFAPYVSVQNDATGDVFLSLIALYANKGIDAVVA